MGGEQWFNKSSLQDFRDPTISYSSRTIAEEKRSRSMEHRRAIADLMSTLGDTPLDLGRVFRHERYHEDLEIERLKCVVRLDVANNSALTHEKGEIDRMKVEESVKDLTSLLGQERIMCKDHQTMEELIMLVLIALGSGGERRGRFNPASEHGSFPPSV